MTDGGIGIHSLDTDLWRYSTMVSSEPRQGKNTSEVREGFEQGQIAEQPFPTQADRSAASKPHPRKRDVNRDFKFMPRGSLATDF